MPSATPLFTKRDPTTGAVLFDFTGHIHAQGLDLDLGTDPGIDLPPSNEVIRWLKANGDQGPFVYGYASTLPDANNQASYKLRLSGKSPSFPWEAEILLESADINNAKPSAASVLVDGVPRVLFDGNGKSDYLQAVDTWHNIPVNGAWTAGQYYSDGNRVWFRGDAVNGAVYVFGNPNAIIGTMPAALHPTTQQRQIIPYTDATNGNGLILLSFNTDGTITLAAQFITNASGAVGGTHRMTGISYRLT